MIKTSVSYFELNVQQYNLNSFSLIFLTRGDLDLEGGCGMWSVQKTGAATVMAQGVGRGQGQRVGKGLAPEACRGFIP